MSQETERAQKILPIACELQETRIIREREREVEEIFRASRLVQELPDGFALEFPPDDLWARRLADFVLFERKCCPFFTFELLFEAGQRSIWLRLRGGEGVKDFIRSMLEMVKNGPVNAVEREAVKDE